MSPLLLLGCGSGLGGAVDLYGIVWDAPKGEGAVVPGAALEVLDYEQEPFASAEAAADGSFVVDVPRGEGFFLTVTGEGRAPTAFSGEAGQVDVYAGDGYPWVASTGWVDALREEFSGCPDAQLDGVVVTGEVRLYLAGVDYQSLALITTGTVNVYPEFGEAPAACYLDDEGVSSGAGERTGDTGRFAVFGVPPGPLIVEVLYDAGEENLPAQLYQYVLDAPGLVPMYPALVYAPE